MSSVLKKLVATAISAAFVVQSTTVHPAFAESGNRTAGNPTTVSAPVVGASKELRARLKVQGEKLAKSGKASKYATAKIRWDDASEKPSQIRGIRTKVSKNVASDVQSVFDDLSPIYGTADGAAKKPKLSVAEEAVSKITSERHLRIKQTYA